MQGPIRIPPQALEQKGAVEANRFQRIRELDYSSLSHGEQVPFSSPLFMILIVKNLHSLRCRGHFFQTRVISELALFSLASVDASPWYALQFRLDKVVGQSYADRCVEVLIWNALAGGNNDYCAILVAVNSILQIVLFAPLAIFFLNVISDENDIAPISYSVVATSVAAFLGIPLGAAVITRFGLRFIAGPAWYDRIFIRFVSPWSLIGLLYTILVLFAAQGHQVVHQIVSVLRVAAPLVVYFAIVFFTTVGICRMLGFEYQFLVTQSFTAASNNFELAIAVAVATFGPNSDEALASTVGPLIEVPVLLGLVYALRWIANRWGWK